MGGGIAIAIAIDFAIDFALSYPGMTASLIAADSALTGFGWPGGRPSQGPAKLAQSDGIEAAKQAWLNSDLFIPAGKQPDVVSRLNSTVADYSGWHWLHENPATAPRKLAIEHLSSIKCPSLIIIGEHDVPDFHEISDILLSEINGSRRVTIPNVGHMSNMEAPVAFNAALFDFLETR